MEREDEDGKQFAGMCFHSPHRDGSRIGRTTDSVSPMYLLSPSADSLVCDSEYITSVAPSSSESITSGKSDGKQYAFLPTVDSSQSTSEQIRNIALRKLQYHGYVQRMGEGPPGELVFSCLKCDERCLGKRAMMNHVFTFHPEVEPYDCQVCANSFHSKNSLKLHYVVAHTYKRMACDVCPKRFSELSLFRNHRLFHELRSHMCDMCNQQFSNYSFYKKHTRSHKQQYKQKNRCGLCLRGFYAEKRYWKHMEQHSSSQIFNCSRCNETFVEESVLVEHWGSHEGQLPHFLCSGCDWLYYTKKERLKHWHTVRNLSERSVKKLLRTFRQSKKLL